MANENATDSTHPAVDVAAVSAPAEVAPGRAALGVEYGNPYDPNTPPYSVYRDPKGEQQARQEEEAAKANKARSASKNPEYRFDGHKEPTEGTQRIKLKGGYHVERGGTAPISDDEVERLRSLGFKLVKASK